jgi:NAD-dependent dihydropyrimidine dehydrogenase PreA subunit
MIVEIYKTKCTGCGICIDNCPNDVIKMDVNGEKAVIKYPEDCTGCFGCELKCPSEAIYVHPVKEKFPSIMERPSGGITNG